ncbi:hypothetical protein WR25_06650 [Diploscapter pachys]|uniref:Uncharacterized protein n=1 Tax=Diploscapter pachys TaxID=2018661 RepID=A0A2A2JU19_9BILA|nr:hypothetical protein WR25_06650 [Diploscapter pachys]
MHDSFLARRPAETQGVEALEINVRLLPLIQALYQPFLHSKWYVKHKQGLKIDDISKKILQRFCEDISILLHARHDLYSKIVAFLNQSSESYPHWDQLKEAIKTSSLHMDLRNHYTGVCDCVAGSDVRLPPRGTSWISLKG